MKKLLKKTFSYLPNHLRYAVIRKLVNVNNSLEKENLIVQIATEKEDFEVAFKLLHDSYVKSGLMDEHASGLRCNSYSFLPHTSIIILKKDKRVIGTVSLIRDSAMGLPSDEKYQIENDELRKKGNVLIEVSSLAIDIDFRNQGHVLTLMLMKFLYNYSRNCSDGQYLVCTIHPRAEDFYRALWGFERRGPIVSYNYVKGALAVYMQMELSDSNEKRVLKSYHSSDPSKNLGLYCLLKDQRFVYPYYQKGQVLEARMTPEILNYFFKIRTNLYNELSEAHRRTFFEIYYYHFNDEEMQKYFPRKKDHGVRDYRTPTRIKASVRDAQDLYDSEILDLNAGGCFLTIKDLEKIELQSEIEVTFSLGKRDFIIIGQPTWKNYGENNRYPPGVGIKFNAHILNLSAELKNWSSFKKVA